MEARKKYVMQKNCRLSRGFTLIELLVVISIIALLLSILLPSLKAARDQARSVVCASRLGQTNLAMNLYAQANKDFLPPIVTTDVDMFWLNKLRPYMPGGREGRTYEIVHCPSIPIEIQKGSTLTYGMNGLYDTFGTQPNVYDITLGVQPKNRLKAKSPGRVIMVTDTISRDRGKRLLWPHPYYGYNIMLIPSSYNKVLYYSHGEADLRHRKATNILYMDGHVISGKVPADDVGSNAAAWGIMR
jgi:prepilin-type N-terminal cleavage/methylation domain-containing protein/prepilin-type processing-associated H-X9-DG protein